MKRRTQYRQGQPIPRCGALLAGGQATCRESPALHPAYDPVLRDEYHPSGRCARHGGASTGPRTPEGKARIAAMMREEHAAEARAEGKRKPSEALQESVARFLEATTWEHAIYVTGLSRRTLERLETGRYCTGGEIAAARAALRDHATATIAASLRALGGEDDQ